MATVSSSLSPVQSQTLPSSNVETSTQLPEEIAQFSFSSKPIAAETFLNASRHEATSWQPSNFADAANNSQPSV